MNTIVKYSNNGINLDARLEDGQAWLTIKQTAELFGVDESTIREHAKHILEDNEIPVSVQGKFPATANDGKSYGIVHYNQVMVTHIGYRVRSERGSEFRRWATAVLEGEAPPLSTPKPLTALQQLALQVRVLEAIEAKQLEQQTAIAQLEGKVAILSAEPDGFSWMPICAYAQNIRLKLKAGEDARLGRLATKLSKERGIEIRKVRVPGSVYATVGSYNLDILRELFGT